MNIASTKICDPSHFKQLQSTSMSWNPTHPPVFIAPRIFVYRKMGVLYLNRRYLPIFDRFLLVVQSNKDRFWNGSHSWIASSRLYNIAAQSLSRHKLRCMKIIIESFLLLNRFPCVSSIVFEAITISISRHVFSRWTEQFGTTHDSLGRKLTILEKCIFRSARDCFWNRQLFENRYNKSIFCSISKRISFSGSALCPLGSAILKFYNLENS